MAIYQSAAEPRPDDEYERGALRHLIRGQRGRLLDPRRTPVSVVEVCPTTGFVHMRIEGFEDAGAIWEIPLEHAEDFQFELDGPLAAKSDVAEMQAAIERFAGELTVETDRDARDRTEDLIRGRQAEASDWLDRHSRFVAEGRALPRPSDRRGDPLLAAELEAWLRKHDLWDIEDALTRVFVSNPGSGETVKGHRIVLAELGLTDYIGPIVRDPATFRSDWTRERRIEHVVARLAFVRALFGRLGMHEVTLWRGASFDGRLRRRLGRSFVSTSFDAAVARSHFENGSGAWTHVLVRQDVPVEQLFMTYHETAAMNTVFLEAEAAVISRPRDGWP